jgi:hypothetical protein
MNEKKTWKKGEMDDDDEEGEIEEETSIDPNDPEYLMAILFGIHD